MRIKLLCYCLILLGWAACTPDPVAYIPPTQTLQVQSQLTASKLRLTLTWNDLGRYDQSVTYTVVLRNYFGLNQYDTVARDQTLNTISNIAVVPNTTINGTVSARTGRGQVLQEVFSFKVGAPKSPDAKYVVLHDVAFERYLVDTKIDSDQTLNGLVLKKDVVAVDSLNLRDGPLPGVDYYPATLEGIGAFVGLKYLNVNTALTDSLDLTRNQQLLALNCQGYNVPGFYQARLMHLKLGNQPRLLQLYCGTSELTTLDLSGCAALQTFSCASSNLRELTLTNNQQLTHIDVSSNALSELNVSSNRQLRYLNCSWPRPSQGLRSLDVGQNAELRELYIQGQTINTPLLLCANTKLLVFLSSQTPIPTISVPFPIDEQLLRQWIKDSSTTYKTCQ